MGDGYLDAESYSGSKQEGITFKEIVLRHLNQIIGFQSTEMRGGFWVTKTKISHGIATETKEYVADSREVFGCSINALYDILLPHFDKTMSKDAEDIKKKLENIKIECLNKTKAEDKEILSNDLYSKDDRLIVEEYRFKKLSLNREMFQKLNLLLFRLKYLKIYEGQAFTGEE